MQVPHILLCFLFANCVLGQRSAIAVLQSTSVANNDISGTVTFTETNTGEVFVHVQLSGLSGLANELGIHIHNWGDITDDSGAAAGPHWVGSGSDSHGCPGSSSRHEGDTGSWNVVNGQIDQTKTLDLITLSGSTSVIGRGVILHDIADPCDSSSTGARIAMGVIGIANDPNNGAHQGTNPNTLICRLQGTANCPSCEGVVWFEDNGSSIRVTARVNGLSVGSSHGIHIHAFGDVSDIQSGTSAGGHFNPDDSDHGLPDDANRHEGDMGNILSFDSNGEAWYRYNNNRILSMGAITGRSVVLHETFDHGSGNGCDAAGSSGVRYAFGVIGVASDDISIAEPPIFVDTSFANVNCVASFSSTADTSFSVSYSSTTFSPNSFSEPTFSTVASFTTDSSSSSTSSALLFSALLSVLCLLFSF